MKFADIQSLTDLLGYITYKIGQGYKVTRKGNLIILRYENEIQEIIKIIK